jgi:uncharacterized protein YwgA
MRCLELLKHEGLELLKHDFLLLVLKSMGEVKGKTRLFKIVYIIQEECKKLKINLDCFYEFRPYYYGPYSKELESDLNYLIQKGFVEHSISESSIVVENLYKITQKGVDYIKDATLPSPVLKVINEVVEKYKNYPLAWLLKEVYEKYPSFLDKEPLLNNPM